MIKTAITLTLLLSMQMFLGCSHNDDSKDKDKPPAKVSLMTLKKEVVETPIEFTATTTPSKSVQIRARIEGYLQSINYRDGSFVKAGKTLFTLDPKPLNIAILTAKASLDAESAKKEYTAQNMKRLEILFEKKISGKQELDAAITDDRTQAALVDGAKAALKKAKLELSYTTITAPISGWVDKVTQYEGSYISPAQNGLLTTINQTSPIFVDFSISKEPMERINRWTSSHKVEELFVELILADGTTYPSRGKILFFSPTVDTTMGSRQARAEFSNAKGEILPGEFVKVRLRGLKYNSIIIPHKALMQGAKGSFVYIVDENKTAQIRVVKVGEWIGENVVIQDGIKEGEEIIYKGNARADAGKVVKIIPHKQTKDN